MRSRLRLHVLVLAGILLAGCPDKKPSGSTPPDEDVPAPADVLDVVDIVDVEPELELPPVDTEEPFEIGYLHPVSPVEAEDLDPADGVVEVALTAAAIQLETPDGLLDGYAFNGQVPGPTIRAKKGDTLRVTLTNHLLTPRERTSRRSPEVPRPRPESAWRRRV